MLLIDMAMSAVLVIAMLAYDVRLTLAVLLLAVLHGLLAHFLGAFRAVRSQAMRREQGLLIGVGMQMLSHADNLRMTGADDRFFSRWSGQQARELHARQLYSELGSVNAALPGLIAALRAAAILGIGGSLVIAGEMTLGSLVAFYILAEMFLAPIGRFLEFADKRQALETDLQRAGGRLQNRRRPRLPAPPPRIGVDSHVGRPAAARRPARTAGPYLRLQQEPGAADPGLQPHHRAGAAGCRGRPQRFRQVDAGPPGGGDLSALVRRHPVRWPPAGRDSRGSVAAVRFHGGPGSRALFCITARQHHSLEPGGSGRSHRRRDPGRVHPRRNPAAAQRQGYATLVEEGGVNFSGGQRQRLEIARALVGNPTVLVLDEATSALDAATEEAVDEALRRRGVTCLIVAHRLSTVRDADEIIVLDKGAEVQRGTHDALIADRAGTYYRLIRSG